MVSNVEMGRAENSSGRVGFGLLFFSPFGLRAGNFKNRALFGPTKITFGLNSGHKKLLFNG